MRKSNLLVATSADCQDVAESLSSNLNGVCNVALWPHMGESNCAHVPSLLANIHLHDFAVLVLPPSDSPFSRPASKILFQDWDYVAAFCAATLGGHRLFIIPADDGEMAFPAHLGGACIGTYLKRSDRHLVSSTKLAARRLTERIAELGARPDVGPAPKFAAAICYKLPELRIRLAKTSKKRWILPKGLVLPNEASHVAALRYAEDEAGVVGRIDIRESSEFIYWKEERGEAQRVAAHLLHAVAEHAVAEEFRAPAWFGFDEALMRLTEGRPAKQAEQLRKVLYWARPQIESASPSLKHLAGALPYRVGVDGTVEFLLVTSRKSGNWLIPKGHIGAGEQAVQAAVREALEEAGVVGEVHSRRAGVYSFRRDSVDHDVQVYALRVTEQQPVWKDASKRKRRWFPRSEAAQLVNETGLRKIIEDFSV